MLKGENACIRLSLAKKLSREKESSSGKALGYFYLNVNECEKRKAPAQILGLQRKSRAEKNITWQARWRKTKSFSKVVGSLFGEERKKQRRIIKPLISPGSIMWCEYK